MVAMAPKLFDESEDESDGGVELKVNDEYARRFEHNKKREERHRCKHCTFCTESTETYECHRLSVSIMLTSEQ